MFHFFQLLLLLHSMTIISCLMFQTYLSLFLAVVSFYNIYCQILCFSFHTPQCLKMTCLKQHSPVPQSECCSSSIFRSVPSKAFDQRCYCIQHGSQSTPQPPWWWSNRNLTYRCSTSQLKLCAESLIRQHHCFTHPACHIKCPEKNEQSH